MIVRGTTPYHNFTLPLLAENISNVNITYLQNGVIVLEKNLEDSGIEIINVVDYYENASMNTEELTQEELNSSMLIVHLTQEETLLFTYYYNINSRKNYVYIQVSVLDNEGEAYRSYPVKQKLLPAFNNSEIEA